MIVVFLRERGFDKIDSIRTVRLLYDMPMPEAKNMIEQSAAWSDRYAHDAHFRDAAIQAIHDLAASNDPSWPKIEFINPDGGSDV
jgi:ribosomal protein L7/L12